MQTWYQRFDSFARKKSVQIPVTIITLVMLPFVIWGWIGSIRQSNTWDVEQKWGAAVREMEQSPPGTQRAEKFLARLKAINPGYSPPELQQAIADYISALSNSLEAMKAGRDTAEFDQRMDDAKQKMIAIARKYD
jgi:hypothetical protein